MPLRRSLRSLRQHPLMLALRYLRRHPGTLAWALLWRTAYVLLPMQVPLLVGALADALAGNTATLYGWTWPASESSQVLAVVGLSLLLVGVSAALASFMRSAASATLARRFVTHLRKAMTERIATMPLGAQRAYGAGELMDRLVSDAGTMRRFIDRVFVQSPTNFVRIAYPVAMLVWLDAHLALLVLAIVPPQWVLLRVLYRRLQTTTRHARTMRADLMGVAKELVDGAEDAQGLGAEEAVSTLAHERADRLEARQLRQSFLAAGVSGVTWLATGVGVALTWWIGGGQVLGGTMSLGTLVAFTGFLDFAYRPTRQMSRIAGTFQSGLVSLERIHDLLDRAPHRPERASAPVLRLAAGCVEAEALGMDYGAGPVLHGVDLALPPGQLTTLVGRSGSGKSTLLRLLAHLYTPTEGRLLLDGQAYDAVSAASLRAHLAFVAQHPVLFSLSVLENVRLGRPTATEADVRAACRAAGADTFIEALPNGYATPIGPKGIDLSGGQTQRLALARALLLRPRLLLLDEPTAALDATCEADIIDTLRRLRGDVTIVMVSHRPQAVASADYVVLLDEGRIAAQGPPEELHACAPLYYELFAEPGFSGPVPP